MVHDKKEFEEFVKHIPQLQDDEVIFVSLSARNKYLTLEEREEFHLGRTEMFGREVVYNNDLESFYMIMKKLSTIREWRKTKNGSTIPDKAMVVYMNLNPSHTVRAMGNFIDEMLKEMFNYNENLVKGNDVKLNLHRFKNCRSIMNTQLQKSASRKMFIDIDVDCTHPDILNEAIKILEEKEAKFFVIKTQGGFHIPILRSTLKFNYIKEVIQHCNDIINESEEYEGIVENNKNFMVPVPGTLQAGKAVKFLGSNYEEPFGVYNG